MRLKVNGNVVDIHTQARLPQGLENDAALAPGDPYREEVPGRLGVGWANLCANKVSKFLFVVRCNFSTPRQELRESSELAGAQGRLNVGYSVIQAKRNLLVVPGPVGRVVHFGGLSGNAMAAKLLKASGQQGVLGGEHAALARGDDLDWVKAKHADVTEAAVSNGLALVERSYRMARVLNHSETELLGECMDGLHVAALAAEMNGNDHARKGKAIGPVQRQLICEQARIDAEGLGVNVDKVHRGTAVESAVRAGDKAIGGGPYRQPFANV